MVVIQCPHCNLEVELDEGVSGLFDCPHCGEEFEWGEMDEEIDLTQVNSVAWVGLLALTLILILYWIAVYNETGRLPWDGIFHGLIRLIFGF